MLVKIENIRPVDLRDILEIQLECGLSPWSHRDYLDELERKDSVLLKAAVAESNCAGFIVGRRVPSSVTGTDLEIYNIGVTPKLRRLRIGSTLIRGVLEICKKESIGNVWLDVRVSNGPARSFYRNFGFEEVLTRPTFYRDPSEDGIIMRRAI
jgi:ribosomal-protein-alanine N-acetyltransferase